MKYETNEEKECRHEQCPYGRENYKPMNGCFWDLMSDSLELLKEQEEQIKNRDESLEKAREEIKWLRGMLKEQETTAEKDGHHIRCLNCGEYWCDNDREGNPFPMNFCPYCGRKVKWE